jgi:hypothetical protein
MPREIRVKGTVLAGLIRGAGAQAPGEVRDALLRRVDPELKDALETNSLGPTVWYPVAWHRTILGFIAEERGAAQLAESVRRSTRDNLGTVHRVLMRALSPASLMTRSAMIFSSFFEGRCEAEAREVGLTYVRWSECQGFDRNCWFAQLTTIDELVSMTGAKQIRRAVLEGGRDGDPGMLVELAWRH